jgi:uncharacterized tellurite resistance protein B-like protein
MAGIDTSAVRGLADPQLEALVEIMYLAAAADGELAGEEQKQFESSILSLTDGRLDSAALAALLDKATQALEAEGREARLAAVKQRLPNAGARKAALALAIQVTAADGIIRTSERELIMETAEALEIDFDEAADLVRDLSP